MRPSPKFTQTLRPERPLGRPHTSKLTPRLLAALIFLAPAHALPQTGGQQPEAPSKEAQSKGQGAEVFCDPARAVALVEAQLSEAKNFDDAARRISLLTRAADLLWPYQRETARGLFTQAYDLAARDAAAREKEPPPEGLAAATRLDQRYVVMGAIARRDAAWARRLAEAVAEEARRAAEQSAKATGAANATGATNASGRSDISDRTLGLAQTLLAYDADSALALARTTFRSPASYGLNFFLLKLAEKNQAGADAFYTEALQAYRGRSASDLAYLAVYPFALNREPASVPVGVYYKTPEGFAPALRLRELFLDALFETAERRLRTPEAARAEDSYMATEHERLLTMLVMLEPLIARVSPARLERALALKGMASAAASARSRGQAAEFARFRGDYEEEGFFDRTVEQLDKERDPSRRDFAVAKLVMGAQSPEEFARAEGFLDKVSDTPLRQKLASYLFFLRTQQAVKDGQLDDAARFSKKVDELDYRALLSLEIAGAALKKLDDRARASELLDAVAAEAAKAPDTPAKARALLGVAHLYAAFDAARAYEVLRAAVKVVNTLPDPDFSSETIGRELGNQFFRTYAVYNVPGMRIENAFRELGERDFESALAAANELSDKYQRAQAVLGLASKCLEASAKKGRRREP